MRTVDADGSVRFNTSALAGRMRSLGEADIISHIRGMSGVSSGSDYASGLSVDGATPSQTMYRIDGAPVFFPYRFGGIFSTFISPHFRSASFVRSVHTSAMPNRLGALIDFNPYSSLPGGPGGEVNAGILASSASLRLPVGSRIALVASGRISYIDRLYSAFLRQREYRTDYRFGDGNVTFVYNPDSINTFRVEGFTSSDRLNYIDNNYALDTGLRWRNSLLSASWAHDARDFFSVNRLYYSSFDNRMTVEMPQLWLVSPSDISALGVSGDFDFATHGSLMSLTAGYEAVYYRLHTLSGTLCGIGETDKPLNISPLEEAVEVRAYGNAGVRLSSAVSLNAGLSATWFGHASYGCFTADPQLTLSWHRSRSTITLQASTASQFLHQAGFSEMGMSTNSWSASSRDVPAQRAAGVTAVWQHDTGVRGLVLSASMYLRRIWNEPEYEGSILQLIDAGGYDHDAHLMPLDGYNTGASVTLAREAGALTGSVGYAYGVARRRLPDGTHVRAHTDAGHSVNAQLSYRLSQHWTIAAAFCLASGRPYTPVRSITVIAENLIYEYGRHNSARLPLYHRLDLSAIYRFGFFVSGRYVTNLVNIGIVNAYGRRNVEAQTFGINFDDATYRISRMYSLYRFMPSVSYTIQF